LPAPGTYQIDPVHTFVYFGAWHHIVGLVRGRFDNTTGTITVSTDPAACALDVTMDTFSVSTQFTERDEDLRSPAFFDVRKFPTMTYQGRGIRKASGDQWIMDGTLTIRGMSKVVPITFSFKGLFPDTPANRPPRASFHATAGAKRGDFGMVRDNKMELGVPPVPGNDVEIEIDVEANKVQPK
jgi:polyisoprenoid-binding protein YceI